jgi:hypothetical protein
MIILLSAVTCTDVRVNHLLQYAYFVSAAVDTHYTYTLISWSVLEKLAVGQLVSMLNYSLLWNLKVHYRVHKSMPMGSILSHMSLIHVLLPYILRSLLILSFYLILRHQCGLFPSGFLVRDVYIFLISSMRAAYPTHLISLDIFTPIFCKEYKLWISSLWNFR